MNVKLTILGSGSNGNCAYVETPQTRFLVDAGLSGRQIALRLQSINRSLDDIQAVFLTHEHTDHTAGLSILANRKQIPVHSNRLTAESLRSRFPNFNNWHIFKTGTGFDFGDIHIETFSVPHDATDPVGYVIFSQQQTIGFLTDLGHATRLVKERIKDCSALVLEANHDIQLLHADKRRPWSVKQRILARHGHLSNDAAAEVVETVASDRLKHIYLSHLSEDCNKPELARAAVARKLDAMNISHITLYDTFQEIPCPTLELD